VSQTFEVLVVLSFMFSFHLQNPKPLLKKMTRAATMVHNSLFNIRDRSNVDDQVRFRAA